MPPSVTFSLKLSKANASGTLTYISVPEKELAKLGTRKRLPVKVRINQYQYQSTIAPMGGEYCIPVRKEVREAAAVSAGDLITVTLEPDLEPRTVLVPDDLARSLRTHELAQASFEAMSYSHRKEYVQWIEGAKRPETRAKRIAQAVDRLTSTSTKAKKR
ncbi:MAG: DUF1905 domain-containing protein [Verrucomicrobia bacterium]|nr:DUF1905 domain-containing protein [Verrucomicrobiota bacterium]